MKRWQRNSAWFDAVADNRSTAGIDAMHFVPLNDTQSPAEALIVAGKLKHDPDCVVAPQQSCDPKAELRRAGYTPLPVKKGDLVLVHGQVDHLSLANLSPRSRHTFQLHLVEDSAQSTWRSTNWQQYEPFPRLHEGTFEYPTEEEEPTVRTHPHGYEL